MPSSKRSYREEGGGRSGQTGDSWVLSPNEIDRVIGKRMRDLQRYFNLNIEAYRGVRESAKLSADPRYVLSGEGLTNHPQKFNWAYLPPSEGCYRVTPRGKLRPWSWLFFHSFGYTWDYGWYLNNPNGRQPPGDANGHHPDRWFAGITQLCGLTLEKPRPPEGRTSIHCCVSRRGDVVWSVDANDVAFHGGGEIQMTKFGNNEVSIGFELEPALSKPRLPNGKYKSAALMPYTDRQMLALAIVCKKLETAQPAIKHFYARRENGSIRQQVAANGGGYIQHRDVFYPSDSAEAAVFEQKARQRSQGAKGRLTKVDATAQFDILPGERGLPSNDFLKTAISGWDQLWNMMDKMRFNLATDVFVTRLDPSEFKGISDLSAAMARSSNPGQRALLQSQRDKLVSLQRANNMQAQDRRALYKQAEGQATTLSSITGKSSAQTAQQANALASKPTAVSGSILTYDYDTGTWKVGGTDTGKAS